MNCRPLSRFEDLTSTDQPNHVSYAVVCIFRFGVISIADTISRNALCVQHKLRAACNVVLAITLTTQTCILCSKVSGTANVYGVLHAMQCLSCTCTLPHIMYARLHWRGYDRIPLKFNSTMELVVLALVPGTSPGFLDPNSPAAFV